MRIRVYVSTNKVGSTCEVEVNVDEDGLPVAKAQREAALEELAREAMFEMIEWGFEPVEEGSLGARRRR